MRRSSQMCTRSATLYSLLKASRCITLPSQQLVSLSSSTHDIGYGTSSCDTDFSLVTISVGVEKVMPFSLAHAGNAFRNSRILEDRGCDIPNEQSSINILITCSSCGNASIQLIYLSANKGYSLHSELEKRRLISSDNLKSRSNNFKFGFILQ